MKTSILKKTESHFLCLVTCGKFSEARQIAHTVVRENLAACVNIIRGIESVYKWKGKVCKDREFLLLLKGNFRKQKSLTVRIRNLHSYDVPEIIFLKINSGSNKYLEWVNKNVIKR